MRQDTRASHISDLANRNEGFQHALINFGQMPDLASLGNGVDPASFGIDPNVTHLIDQNTQAGLSTVAQLKKQYEDARNQHVNDLAARGILQSGETGYRLGQDQQAYTAAQSQASQELLDYLRGVQQAFAQNEQGRQQQLTQGAQQAYQNQMALPQNQPTAASHARLVHGAGWYRGPDGTLYQPNGHKVDHAKARVYNQGLIQQMRRKGWSWSRIQQTRAWKRWKLAGGH